MNTRLLCLASICLFAGCSAAWASEIEQAEKFNAEKKYREAFRIANDLVIKNPDDKRALAVRQNCCIKLWKPQMALNDILYLRKLEPTRVEWYGQLAQAMIEIEQFDKIPMTLMAASQLAPGSVWEDAQGAWALQNKKDWKGAEAAWNKCVSRFPKDAFVRLSRATLFETIGKDKEAVQDLDVVKQNDPRDQRPYVLRILLQMKKDKTDEALKVASELEKLNPISGLGARASILTHAKDFDRALPAWNEIVKLEPNEIRWRTSRASVYLEKNQRKKAFDDLYVALACCSRNKYMKAQVLKDIAKAHAQFKEYTKAIAQIDEAMKVDPSNSYNFLVARAEFELGAGKTQAALSDLENALRMQPSGLDALLAIANLYVRQNNWGMAEPFLMKAINLGAGDRATFVKLYELYIKKPDEQKAGIVLHHWRESCPGDKTPFLYSARLSKKKGNAREALEYYDAALKRGAEQNVVYAERVNLLRRVGRLDDAIATYTKLLEIDSHSVYMNDWYLGRASAYKIKHDYENALKDCNKAIETVAKEGSFRERADIYSKLGKYDEALADVDKAIELSKNGSSARRLKARILADSGRYTEARKEYTQLIVKLQTVPELYRERGKVFEKLGDKERAAKDFKRAEELESSP